MQEEIRQPRLLINRKKPIATYTLAVLNVVVYLADLLTEQFLGYPLLTMWGAKINVFIFYGQWWRLVTPMFLHGSLSHIIFNMFVLVMWGRQLESLLGKARYLLVYFAAGVLGSGASYAFSEAMSVGASGAIFGLFGALLFFRRQYKDLFKLVFGVQVLIIIGVNLVNGFITPNIDNFGHLGGLAGGFVACGITGFYGQKPGALMRWGCALLYILLLGGLLIGKYYYYLS